MSQDARLDDLLLEYEERRTSPEVLCRDCPELLDDLKRGIATLACVDRLLGDSAPTQMSELLPSVPGFAIVQELGRGGMGVVYKAWQVSLKRWVALKMILAGSHAGAEQHARLQREAEAVARVRHPHIVQIHDIGSHEGKPYLVLECIEGASLDKQTHPWPCRQAAELVRALALAVQAAHQAGIIHRDLKPANILLETNSSTAKIADFGLAKLLDTPSGQTQTGDVLGTPSYMAPEQAAGDLSQLGPWTDTYALGAILYELLTGRPPFKGNIALETLHQVRTQEPTPLRDVRPDVPRELETICLRALQKEPAQRYATAQELADDLERFLLGQPIQARADSLPTLIWRWICRPERVRDAGIVIFINAAVRSVAIVQMYLILRNLTAEDLEREPWLPAQMTVWLIGMCVALYWIAWRVLGRHVFALWAGFALAAVYLSTRSLATFIEADDERIFLYSLLFVVQFTMCAVALIATYSSRRS